MKGMISMDIKFSLNDRSEGERAFAPENKEKELKDLAVSEISDNTVVHTDYSVYVKEHHPVFEKVPYTQFKNDWYNLSVDGWDKSVENPNQIIKEIYENIQLPKRSTPGSAGYDFRIPFDFTLYKDSSIVIPTGIRCKMPKNCVLLIVPRSGLGFKYRLSLMNTIGVIDSDYYTANNYGHIMIKLIYDGDDHKGLFSVCDNSDNADNPFSVNQVHKLLRGPKDSVYNIPFKANQGFAQGIFVNYCVTANEILENEESKMKRRTGGMGSTT